MLRGLRADRRGTSVDGDQGAFQSLFPRMRSAMRRRQFVTLLGGAMLALAGLWPLPLLAQTFEKPRRIGILIPYPESDVQAQLEVAAMRDRLQQLGWASGRNARITYAGRPATSVKYKLTPRSLCRCSRTSFCPELRPRRSAHQGDPHHSDRVCRRFGSGRSGLCRKHGAARRQCHGLHQCRGANGREVGRGASGNQPGLARAVVMFGAKTSPEGGDFYLRRSETPPARSGLRRSRRRLRMRSRSIALSRRCRVNRGPV